MAFFSGQDIKTLQSEGNDTNCFVSLIVDTKGTYQAAITRKVKSSTEVVTKSLSSSYAFFGEGDIKTNEDSMSESTRIVDREIIEYFMLDVEREIVDNPYDFLDRRFEEIELQKNKQIPNYTKNLNFPITPSPKWNNDGSLDTEEMSFKDWLNKPKDNNLEEPTLFSKEEMGETESSYLDWKPDPATIHYMTCQMVTSSLIINKDIDLKQWIVHNMEKVYDKVFKDMEEFECWADSMEEFILNHYNDPDTPTELYVNWDLFMSKIAEAILYEIDKYPDNKYLDVYKDLLTARIYE